MNSREYRRLLGLLLVWAVAPMPFLYIVMPSFYAVAIGVGLCLAVWPKKIPKLSRTALNLIGIVIVVAVFAAGGLRVGPLRPLGHLLLLLTSVRSFVVKDRQTFLRAMFLVFLVWIVAVTSSTHVTVILYFAVSTGLWWWVGMRILLDGIADGDRRFVVSYPRPVHAVLAAFVSLVLAIPVFVALPRLQSPWISGRGGVSSVTGFSSHVDLAGVGPIRISQEVALTVRSVSGQPIDAGWMRLRATAFERVTLYSWAPRRAEHIPEERGGVIWLHGNNMPLDQTVELEIELLRPRRYLFVPEGTVAIASAEEVRLDPAGGVALKSWVRHPLRYTVWIRPGEAHPATDQPLRLPQRFQPHPEVRALGQAIVEGFDTDTARAEAVESYLQQNFSYSLNGMAQMGADPVAWFLLHQREGHCEYFAGAMVALLTDLGIPARVVGGYSGGSLAVNDTEAIVRNSNAHSWVEAWVGNKNAWTVYDPTPAGEVPALLRPSGRQQIRWAWQWVQSTWDRYLLTFGFGEQVRLVTAATEGAAALARMIESRHLAGVVVFGVAVGVAWRLRKYLRLAFADRSTRIAPAADMVAKIARRLERSGVEVPPRATIRWIANRARGLWPDAGATVGELVWLAEQELYADNKNFKTDRTAARRLWLRINPVLKSKSPQDS